MVEAISRAQPFEPFMLPPQFGQGNYSERFGRHQEHINQLQRQLDELIQAILRHHAHDPVQEALTRGAPASRSLLERLKAEFTRQRR